MENNSKRVLLVDDDAELCRILGEYLRGSGFDVETLHDGQQAIRVLQMGTEYDAVVLDIMMPKVSGLDVLQTLRRQSEIPILMLTGRGDDVDCIVGLELGADDYLGKPCNPRELVARLNAIFRRTKNKEEDLRQDLQSIQRLGLELNPGMLTVSFKREKIEFTSAEFRVLQLLLQNAGQTLSKEFLTEQVLNRKLTAHDRSIDVHISRVRQKLSRYADLKSVIKSVRGVGYQMVAQN